MLSLHDIHKRHGGTAVLRGLTLELAPGEVFGLLGPNGAGKSTTLRVITGLTRPDRGTVRLQGIARDRDPATARRLIGAQIDRPAFWEHLSLRANLELLAGLQGVPAGRAGELLLTVGLANHAACRARDASTGMRQRLGIAAALLGEPRVLILDEPTAGLDPHGRESLLGLIRRLATDHGPTVLLTSHLFDEVAALCDRVGVLDGGRLVHSGPVAGAAALRTLYFARTEQEVPA